MAARRSGYPDKDIQGFKPAPCPTAAGAVEYKVRHRGRLLVPFFIAGQLLIEDALMARHRPYEIGLGLSARLGRHVAATLSPADSAAWLETAKGGRRPDGCGALPQAGHGDRAPSLEVESRPRVDPFDIGTYTQLNNSVD